MSCFICKKSFENSKVEFGRHRCDICLELLKKEKCKCCCYGHYKCNKCHKICTKSLEYSYDYLNACPYDECDSCYECCQKQPHYDICYNHCEKCKTFIAFNATVPPWIDSSCECLYDNYDYMFCGIIFDTKYDLNAYIIQRNYLICRYNPEYKLARKFIDKKYNSINNSIY